MVGIGRLLERGIIPESARSGATAGRIGPHGRAFRASRAARSVPAQAADQAGSPPQPRSVLEGLQSC